jgi:hypothetical protein
VPEGASNIPAVRKRCALLLLSLTAMLPASQRPAMAHQRSRVAASAADIRGFRLTRDHLRKVTEVTRAMDRVPSRGPEAPRSDAAMFTVLSMALSYNEPYTERTVPETVRTIQGGHPELAAAVQQAGLTLPDYVLAQITLLLTYPVVAAERHGRPIATPDDVSAANLAFVRAHWAEVEQAMAILMNAVAPYAVGLSGREGRKWAARGRIAFH